MNGLKICGTGSYLPPRIVGNDELAGMVDTNDDWISSRTGIRMRHVSEGETTVTMAFKAACSAMEAARITPQEIDLIICATVTPEFNTPSNACLLQKRLGAQRAFAFDINAACSGFVFALDIAQKYLSSGMVGTALVVSTEALSHITDYQDRSTCVLFGDGAGACILKASEKRYASHLFSDGADAELLYAGTPYPLTPFETQQTREMLFDAEKNGYLHMEGRKVYKFAVEAMPQSILNACEKINISAQELNLIIPHQANIRIIQTAMKHLKLPMEKAFVNIERIGNTSSSTIPIALDEANRTGRIQVGDLIALAGFGAGLTSAAVVLEW